MGDVSVYIEAEQIVCDEPFSFEEPWNNQPSQTSYEAQYGTTGWSNNFFSGWGTSETFATYENTEQECRYEVEDYGGENVGMQLSPSRNTLTHSSGKQLALIHENEEFDEQSSSSEDLDEHGGDEEDDSDEEEEEEVLRRIKFRMNIMSRGHLGLKMRHTPRS